MLLAATSLQAGGSFAVDGEFAAIKAQIPEIWQVLNNAFDFADSGGASIIGSNVNARLGHRRVGPYCLAAKPKGQEGKRNLLFCFNTEYLWLDAKGQKSTISEAYDVREKFLSIEISPLQE